MSDGATKEIHFAGASPIHSIKIHNAHKIDVSRTVRSVTCELTEPSPPHEV